MPIKTFKVVLYLQNREFTDLFVKAIKVDDRFTVVSGKKDTEPDLLIHELSENWEQDLERIQSYLEFAENTDVFIVAENSDPQLLLQAMRVGVKEVLPAPLDTKTVAEALARFKDRHEKKLQKAQAYLGKIISVIGSKGGVGTTSVAVNLADALIKKPMNPAVAIIDMNMVFGDIPMFLDITPKHSWGDITKGIDRLDEFFLSNVMSKTAGGLHVLASPRYLDDNPAPTAQMMEALLTLMTQKYDYIVVDLGQSINDAAFKTIQLSSLVQVVTIQSLPCLSNANRLIQSLLKRNFTSESNLNIILNRYIKRGMVTLETAKEGLGQKIGWIVPNDYDTSMTAINSGKTLFDTAPRSKLAKSFSTYADSLLQENIDKKKKKGWFF
jgi:pilus assembly protein CpaE